MSQTNQHLPISALYQLRAYVGWAEDDGTYYGDRAQFDLRHEGIKLWLDRAIQSAESQKKDAKAARKSGKGV